MNTEKLAEVIKELAAQSAPKDGHPYKIGAQYFIRTVTMAHTGRLVAVYQNELVLEDAAWIADTGRFANFLSGKDAPAEVEPFAHPVVLGRGSIIDATLWPHTLPREQK